MCAEIKYKKLKEKTEIPYRATVQSAGADLKACLDEPVIEIKPHETVKIPLGFATEFLTGFTALILPRSGVSLKKSLAPINAPGLIDADYRGEWAVLLHNYSDAIQRIEDGERIAQVVFIAPCTVVWREADKLNNTERDKGGFGSTGAK